MKNLTYKEAVAAWTHSLLEDSTILRQNIAEGCTKAYMGDTLAYGTISRRTEDIEEDGINLLDISKQIDNYKKNIRKLHPEVGYIRVTQEDDVDFTTYGDGDTSVDSVTISFKVIGLVPKSTEDILTLNLTDSATKHSFQVWLFRYTEDKEKHSSYVGYFPVKCELLKLYKEGTINLITLQKTIHGGCDV